MFRWLQAIPTPQTHLALVTAMSVCVASVGAFYLHLGAPWWAAISAWIVAHADMNTWQKKSVQRILASILGSFIGYQLMVLFQGQPFPQALCIFSIGATGIYKRLTSTQHSYAWILGSLTAILVMMAGISDIETLQPIAIERAMEVGVGVLSAGLITRMFMGWGSINNTDDTTEKTPDLPVQKNDSEAKSSLPVYMIDRDTFNWILAIAGGCAMALIPLIHGWIALPGMTQFAISVGVCLNGRSYQIRNIGLQRIMGCCLGAGTGILLTWFSINSLFVLEILIFAVVFVLSGIHHGDRKFAAIGTQAGVAFLLCTLSSSGPVETILPALERFVGILSALICVSVFASILEEVHLRRRAISASI